MVDRHVLSDCVYTECVCGGIKDDGALCYEPIEKRFIFTSREAAITEFFTTAEDLGRNSPESPVEEELITVDEAVEHEKPVVPVARCPHELMNCPNHCGESFSKFQLMSHLDTDCSDVQDQCPICTATMSRRELPNHLNVCPDRIVPCSSMEFGCIWVGKQHALIDEHSRTCRFVALAPALMKQSNRISGLEQENKVLRQKLDRVLILMSSKDHSTVKNNTPQNNGSSNNNITTTSALLPASTSTSSASTTNFTDTDFMRLFMEGERFREEIDRVTTTLGEMEMRHGMSLLQESFRTGEEISNLRKLINTLRNQMHFLWTERRSWSITQNNTLATAAATAIQTPLNPHISPELDPGSPSQYGRFMGPRRLSDITRQNIKL